MKHIIYIYLFFSFSTYVRAQKIDIRNKSCNGNIIICMNNDIAQFTVLDAILISKENAIIGNYRKNSMRFNGTSTKVKSSLSDSLLLMQTTIKETIDSMFANKNSDCDSYLKYKIFVIQNQGVKEFDLDYPVLLSICPLTEDYNKLYDLVHQTYTLYSK